MSKLSFSSYSQDIYEKHFDSKAYTEALVGENAYAFRTTFEDSLYRCFKEGILAGKTMLDFGCGPTPRAAITASGYVSEITLADLVEQNRNEVEKWLRKAPDALKHSWEFNYVADLEKEDPKNLEERVRKSIVEVIRCDFMLPNPLHPKKAQQFDIVTSSLCLDCLTTISDYMQAMKNVATLIKPGGKLAIFGIYGSPNYTVGNVQYPSSVLTEEDFKKSVAEAGMELLEHHIQNCNMTEKFTDFVNNTFFAVAKKL